MDKNAIIGMGLIGLIMVLFFYMNQPSEQQIARYRQQQDSMRQVQKMTEQSTVSSSPAQAVIAKGDAALPAVKVHDEAAKKKWGLFAHAAGGEKREIVLENNLLRVTLSTLGGNISKVELKKHFTWEVEKKQPITLVDSKTDSQTLLFFANHHVIHTKRLFFNPVYGEQGVNFTHLDVSVPKEKEGDEAFNKEQKFSADSVVLRLSDTLGGYIDISYTISPNSYLIRTQIAVHNMEFLSGNSSGNKIQYQWEHWLQRNENPEGTTETAYTGPQFMFLDGSLDDLIASEDAYALESRVKWLSHSQHFFSSTFVAEEFFAGGKVSYTPEMRKESPYMGKVFTQLDLPIREGEAWKGYFLFGPNQFENLAQYGVGIEEQINLGWGIFGWVNRSIVIPIFGWLQKYITNYGLIIIILTLIIKLMIFPLTFRSYLSQAKMKILKPEIDELGSKFSSEKKMEKQQAIMGLYRKAGVNPLGGCIPMLIQLPILFAMFRFFPVSFEFRQKEFLWAEDLSSFESIASLPFHIPGYGSHVSLFCILMAISSFAYTKMTNSLSSVNQQMPGMKTMLYIMPFMLMIFFNSYASGLSLYYFLSNLITMGQMYIMRAMINEEKLHNRMKANKAKPVVKSKWQQRLEEMQKRQVQKAKQVKQAPKGTKGRAK